MVLFPHNALGLDINEKVRKKFDFNIRLLVSSRPSFLEFSHLFVSMHTYIHTCTYICCDTDVVGHFISTKCFLVIFFAFHLFRALLFIPIASSSLIF